MATREEPVVRDRVLYIATRWRFLAVTVGIAAVLAFTISEFMPRRYTATVTVIIDPPAAADPRAATVLNPAYLDSLTTFEHYFDSDALFQQAAPRFHLDPASMGVTALRKKVLKVAMQHQSRVLEVSATLPDPKNALALAQYIAQQGIQASRDESLTGDRDSLASVSEELDNARTRLDQARAEWQRIAHDDTPETLRAEVSSAIGLLSETKRLHEQADAEAAEWRVRARDGAAEDRQSSTVLANAGAARGAEYAAREKDLSDEIATKRKLVAESTARHALASAELDSAQRACDAALARSRDYGSLTGMRGERMHVVDPGVEPRKPSSPKVLLNTLAAGLLAACIAIAWLNLMAGMPIRRPTVVRSSAALHEERSLSR